MQNLRKDFKIWIIALAISLVSLLYIKLDSGTAQPQYLAESAKFLLEEHKENESVKIMDSDLVKKLSKAIFHLIIRE